MNTPSKDQLDVAREAAQSLVFEVWSLANLANREPGIEGGYETWTLPYHVKSFCAMIGKTRQAIADVNRYLIQYRDGIEPFRHGSARGVTVHALAAR